MPMETYRLEIRETEEPGIDADVYDSDDTVAESTYVSYDDYDLEPPSSNSSDGQQSYAEEVTADVTTIDLQYERDDAGFVFRLLGDRDELASVRIDAEE
ncbi:hypothetical protein [Halopiger xanaduensis]|uniref:Uncharacterized protein n=1 Tax=Halopiger xanaduensis (strain DSM 18323 / JCM 14033 / SH-6) TaxID=797210 RepID=F8D324_HALXS|nr:hypothetical protein [Halopiger xanaduensis]AEH37308.1 hypothetical protein Halxa_2691 [Halopiger xanaduensis SH-6]